jgi:hypothetical protein
MGVLNGERETPRGRSHRSVKIPRKSLSLQRAGTSGTGELHRQKETGTEAPVEMIILFSTYHCFNLRPYQPTVTIIKNIIMISAHSERVGIGSGDGVTLETAGPKGSVMSPEAGLVSPYWPSVSGSVTVLPETETRLVQSTQAPLMLLRYCVPAGKGCG